jgi:hypothetical protein
MVNAHPGIAIIHETHWIARFFKKRIGITPDGFVTSELISELCNYHRFHLLNTSRSELEQLLESSKPISYADFITGIFNMFGQRSKKRFVGDKTTGGYLRNIPLLHSLWPKARFIHLIRDGRDVCLSMLNWPKANKAAARYAIWKEDPVATTALWWKWQVQHGVEEGRSIGSDCYKQIRYESLVQNPEDECKSLCFFLDLPFDHIMLRFNEDRQLKDPGLSANRAWLSPTTGLRNWRTQMPEQDIETFEAIVGDLLSSLGYERAFTEITPKVMDASQRFQSWWDSKHGKKIIENII